MKVFLAILFVLCLAGSASACDGFGFSQFNYGHPVVVQQFANPYQFGFAQPVFSVHKPFAFRHGFGFRQPLVRQRVIIQRNGLFGFRQRVIVRH